MFMSISSQNSALFRPRYLALAVVSGLLLTACGSDDDGNNTTNSANTVGGVASLKTGNLLAEPVNTKTLSAKELKDAVEKIEPTTVSLVGDPVCGVQVQYMHYDTVDAKGQVTDATGAVFIPTGADPKCKGERPIVLHAHGTAVMQNYNFAEVGNAMNEAGLRATTMAATFAGHGYVVIAPNYAGYDKSKLNYHPYLNAKQQSHEMADALKAGRNVLNKLSNSSQVKDNGKLFLTGYSQGGHVAMATARYFDQLNEPVTASMPMSGPYAMGAFGDAVFAGNVMVGGTIFAPLMARNYQEQYGNIYQKPSDIFALGNTDEIPSLLPSKNLTIEQLIGLGKLPLSALFQKMPTGNPVLDKLSPQDAKFSFGFDTANYLITNNYRLAYLGDMQKNPDWSIPYLQGNMKLLPVPSANPEHPLRKALKDNDLRGYIPKSPMVLCGGNQDPMVFFDVNTNLMQNLWLNTSHSNMKVGFVDIDATNQEERQKKNLSTYKTYGFNTMMDNQINLTNQKMQKAFANQLQAVTTQIVTNEMMSGKTQEMATQLAKTAVLTKYHGFVTPYCMASAQAFFNQF